MSWGYRKYTYPGMTVFYVTLNGTQIGRFYLNETDVKQAIEDIQKGKEP